MLHCYFDRDYRIRMDVDGDDLIIVQMRTYSVIKLD